MANEKLTKSSLAKAMGISRPTLDKYLKEGFPKIESEQTILNARKIELGRRKIEIENGIKKTKGKYECILDRREAMKKAIAE